MKKNILIKGIYFTYGFLFSSAFLHSQSCGFDFIFEKNLREDTMAKYRIELFDRDLQENQKNQMFNLRANVIIPVVVHVVWNSEYENISNEIIFSQIDILNKDFNAENNDFKRIPMEFKSVAGNVGIRFCLADKTPTGEKTDGIVRVKTLINEIGIKENLFFTDMGGSDAWNTDKYLNIWVANTGSTITGFGTLPGQTSAAKTGVVINRKYFGRNFSTKYGLGRVAVHEIGHFFGLYHLWGKTIDDNCETDDEVEDTPSQLQPYTECPFYPQFSCSHSSLFMNFMDYVDDPCMIMFTRGQRLRMLKTIELYRRNLPQSKSQCNNLILYQNQVQVFPNPFSNQINIDFISYPLTTQIYDLNGKLILTSTITESNRLIETTQLAKGVYFLSIQTPNFKDVRKVVKIK